jgi:NTP pyrophosphatase (non-canonical NTP hydrolase)
LVEKFATNIKESEMNRLAEVLTAEELSELRELRETWDAAVARLDRLDRRDYTSTAEMKESIIDAACNGDLPAYQVFVQNLASERSIRDFESKLITSGLGLAGEGGECAEVAKKTVFHGKAFDEDDYIKELGDLMWYIAFSANMLGVTIEEIVRRNVLKLKDRYKSGKFTTAEFEAKEAAKNA